MEDLISGAESFSSYLRLQLFKKNCQTFDKATYMHKIWGSQIKGGLEVCDAILLENQDKKFSNSDDLINRYKSIIPRVKEEIANIEFESSIVDFSEKLSKKYFIKSSTNKMFAIDFKKDVRLSALRGIFLTLIKLLEYSTLEKMELDVLIGEVHIIRMKLWNTYRDGDRQQSLREVDVLDTMELNPENLVLK